MNTDPFQEPIVAVHLQKAGKQALAIVNISFVVQMFGAAGLCRIKGFRVMLSKYGGGYAVQPPAYKAGMEKWVDVFFVENIDLWHKIKEKILAEYEAELKKANPL